MERKKNQQADLEKDRHTLEHSEYKKERKPPKVERRDGEQSSK